MDYKVIPNGLFKKEREYPKSNLMPISIVPDGVSVNNMGDISKAITGSPMLVRRKNETLIQFLDRISDENV